MRSDAKSNYGSLQLQARFRFGTRLNATANYFAQLAYDDVGNQEM
jgi:hypothetical protein